MPHPSQRWSKGVVMIAMKPLCPTRAEKPGKMRAREGFVAGESGTLAVLSLFVFVAMLLVAGIAVDMMRHENERVRMQGAADRAVVAATMLRETPGGLTPQQILTSYLTAEGLEGHIAGRIQVVENAETGRTVTVVPAGTVPTLFMRMLGVNDLPLAALAEANEAIANAPDVELVMVLDVSGSMGSGAAGNRRIDNMRNAAANLAEQLLQDAPPGRIAITLVPYDAWVLPPAGFLNFFPNVSGSGACFQFSDFSTITNTFNRPIQRTNCNTSAWRLVRPYLHDLDATVAAIQDLRPSGTTSIDLGVNVGAMFFDPTVGPFISQMISNGAIDPVFEGRPYAWNRPNTLRAMLLLTDGENCCGARVSSAQADLNAIATCNALRDMGVTVYSVAFEAPPRGVTLMQNCATSENHFFNTSGAGLADVFQGIGNHIQTQALRLTR